ncbi:hypothetical protein PO909_015906 [Leuciscus waleckii]
MDTPGPQRHIQDEGRARKCRGSRSLVLITVCLGILCLLLIAAVTLQHFQCSSKRGFLWGPDGLFMSSEPMSWSDSRHYCRDRGADLIIINTEEKQRRITSFIKERVWIGLYEIENEGIMKWVDDSPLTQGVQLNWSVLLKASFSSGGLHKCPLRLVVSICPIESRCPVRKRKR